MSPPFHDSHSKPFAVVQRVNGGALFAKSRACKSSPRHGEREREGEKEGEFAKIGGYSLSGRKYPSFFR